MISVSIQEPITARTLTVIFTPDSPSQPVQVANLKVQACFEPGVY